MAKVPARVFARMLAQFRNVVEDFAQYEDEPHLFTHPQDEFDARHRIDELAEQLFQNLDDAHINSIANELECEYSERMDELDAYRRMTDRVCRQIEKRRIPGSKLIAEVEPADC